ncbi:GNAT family N-acetyltransferase [Candidatus Sumerlaeota bacterium]|nr:GNAT family N-acetyltransferase [Candidatus Sumerlaeota bacterium]
MTNLIESPKVELRIRELRSVEELYSAAADTDLLALPEQDSGRYIVGFAVSRPAIESALRLRYEVFNLELGEGLSASHLTGLDEDEFDAQMSHLVLMDRETGRIVGTYRLQTASRAMQSRGLYSSLEFDLDPMRPLMPTLVELGRVCIDPEHRSLRTLHALFSGVAAFVKLNNCTHMFGCCSITTRDPDDGWRALKSLRKRGYLDSEYYTSAQPECSCGPAGRELDPAIGEGLKIPTLFTTYVRLGAKVVSEPAIDREFGTVDFLVLINATEMFGG